VNTILVATALFGRIKFRIGLFDQCTLNRIRILESREPEFSLMTAVFLGLESPCSSYPDICTLPVLTTIVSPAA
jgi:hypothetical protein